MKQYTVRFVETHHFCLLKQANVAKQKSTNPTHAGMTIRTISKATKNKTKAKHDFMSSLFYYLVINNPPQNVPSIPIDTVFTVIVDPVTLPPFVLVMRKIS